MQHLGERLDAKIQRHGWLIAADISLDLRRQFLEMAVIGFKRHAGPVDGGQHQGGPGHVDVLIGGLGDFRQSPPDVGG